MKKIKAVIFTGGLLVGFIVLSKLLTPSWNYPKLMENHTASIQEFDKIESGKLDACFLGTSHMAYAVDPMSIYETEGLVTYNMATNVQPIAASYYMAQKAILEKKAKVIVLDVSRLFMDRNEEPYYRFILDSDRSFIKKLSLYKEMIRENLYDESNISYLDYLKEWTYALIPIFRYHSRWNELSSADFESWKWKYFMQGYFAITDIRPANINVQDMNNLAGTLSEQYENNTLWYSEDGEVNFTSKEEVLYKVDIPETNIEFLKKIKKLCEENGCKLLLVKVPTIEYPQVYASAWTQIKSNKIKELSDALEIPYLDLLYDCDLDIDWTKDSFDNGRHMNYRGARKITEYIGKYLKQEYDLKSQEYLPYEKKKENYHKVAQVANLQTQTTFPEYISMLCEMGKDVDIYMAVSDDMKVSLTSDDIDALHLLGLQFDFEHMKYQDSYIAIVSCEKVIYEGSSNRKLFYEKEINDGLRVSITSSGWYNGAEAEIKINDLNYAVNSKGINIVVYDKASSQVIDSVCFDTWDPRHICTHSIGDKLFLYEKFLFEQ